MVGERDDWIQSIQLAVKELALNPQVDQKDVVALNDMSLNDQKDGHASGQEGISLFGVNVLRVHDDGQFMINNQLMWETKCGCGDEANNHVE